MTTATRADQERLILDRVIKPKSGSLSTSAARAFLKMDFDEEDRQRMHELSRKAQEGTLTAEEQEVMEMYDRLGHFLAILHSKARRALKNGSGH